MNAEPLAAALAALLADEDADLEVAELVERFGWPALRAHLLETLEDPSRSVSEWTAVASILYVAALDGRPLPDDRVIALLYARLPPDEGSAESNLAWSLATVLRKVPYLSGYEPLADAAVLRELASVRRR